MPSKKQTALLSDLGSLYTNVIPSLLVNGVTKAIKESAAIKVYISNIMTEPGQTDEYSVSDHLNAIIEHCGNGIVDYCIYDTGEVIPELIKKYNKEGQDLVEQDIDKVRGIKFLQRNLSTVANSHIRHDPGLVAASVIELICDDLRYQDKQNDPQYLMLNNKLREEKRIGKIKKAMKKKEKKKSMEGKRLKTPKSKSKFSSKYQDRIEAIREADEKFKNPQEEKEMTKKEIKEEKKKQKEEQKLEKKQAEEITIEEEIETKIENTRLTTELDLEKARQNLEHMLEAAKADLERTRINSQEMTKVEEEKQEDHDNTEQEEPSIIAPIATIEKPIKTKKKPTTKRAPAHAKTKKDKTASEKPKTTKPKSARGRKKKTI